MALFARREARRRWQLAEAPYYEVIVDPTESLSGLIEKGRFTHAPREAIAAAFEPHRGQRYSGKFELVKLLEAPFTAEELEIIRALFMAGQLDEAMKFQESRPKRDTVAGVDNALALLAERGYRPATAHEFLDFIVQHPPKFRRQHDIVALGAIHRHEDVVRVLEVYDRPIDRTHELALPVMKCANGGSMWLEHHRFLAIAERPDAITFIP
ncbi:hypothetical protein A3C96_02450 [Candidatus Uhrbacteria bacterium RIFCSPHIGHO2_02_FULL_60_10]|uniref:Uncharacterized protein n=1 Tax=Candidatus Uhrbacteria bacterium RIFCSPHIGHO2_02_FULL_60_10 TaxID=1802392 RepID=A0A1F7U7Y4_9BACT|nr:MAG: hypothetical protein A3C96_02450 [Candidatus Uhrbacteria bacterium RIFCSPHIGHO2_02_FULL_60_10]